MKTKTSIRLSVAAQGNIDTAKKLTGSNQTAVIENALAVYSAILQGADKATALSYATATSAAFLEEEQE